MEAICCLLRHHVLMWQIKVMCLKFPGGNSHLSCSLPNGNVTWLKYWSTFKKCFLLCPFQYCWLFSFVDAALLVPCNCFDVFSPTILVCIVIFLLFSNAYEWFSLINSHGSVFCCEGGVLFQCVINSLQRDWKQRSVQQRTVFFRGRGAYTETLLLKMKVIDQSKMDLCQSLLLCSRWSSWDLNVIKLIFEVYFYPNRSWLSLLAIDTDFFSVP